MRGEKGVDVGVGIGSVKNPPLVQPEQTHFYICLHIVCLCGISRNQLQAPMLQKSQRHGGINLSPKEVINCV